MNYMSFKDYLNLSNVESDEWQSVVRKIEKIMEYDTRIEKELRMEYLLLMSLQFKNCIDKKEFYWNQWQFKKNYSHGRAGQHSYYHGIAKAETSVHGWLGIINPLGINSWKERISKMVFGVTKDDSVLHRRLVKVILQ